MITRDELLTEFKGYIADVFTQAEEVRGPKLDAILDKLATSAVRIAASSLISEDEEIATWSDAELAQRMREHVSFRSGNQLKNSAWAMMLAASDRLAAAAILVERLTAAPLCADCGIIDPCPECPNVVVDPGVLWCCHVRGPDDVHAAPDYETALKWADLTNAINWRASGGFKNPESYEDCLLKAVPAIWPHSHEAHAANLPKSIADFAIPSFPSDELA